MKKMLILMSLAVISVFLVSCNLFDKSLTGNAVSPYKCTDSDGGRNPEVQGTVKNEIGSFTDVCKDARTLQENYCKSNVQRVETVPCLNGCKNGACSSLLRKA